MKIQRHTDLDVYKKAFDAAMDIFEMSKSFPKEETYSLTDQIRRSSRSVCANLAEAGERDGMSQRLSRNFRIPKAKRLRHKFGSNLPFAAGMLIESKRRFFTKHTMKYCVCSLQ